MSDADLATSFAIFAAKQHGDQEVTADHILVGCLRAISRFGIARLGAWNIDLESLGVDWVRQPDGPRLKLAYSQDAVDLFDSAARIAKSAGDSGIGVSHLLAAFATEERGLMGDLKRSYGITNASWRAAIADLGSDRRNRPEPEVVGGTKEAREYLTPEEAAESLSIHVQTMRAYIRRGRVPAFRLAGERAIRILRADLPKVLEHLRGEKKEE